MKALSKSLFAASPETRPKPRADYKRESAFGVGLPESWFRDAIYDNPELVIEPCREADRLLPGEEWFRWAKEFNFGRGPVDVLLISSHGRPAIIETKLSYNPEKRREVVAQVLDYASSLQELSKELQLQESPFDGALLPRLPESDFEVDSADVLDCIAAGRMLLIIAGDALDPRAIRLSELVLAKHLTSEWDLAMVDLNTYRSTRGSGELLIVPELRGVVVAEKRQVVTVKIEPASGQTRVLVEHLPPEDLSSVRRPTLASLNEFMAGVRQKAPKAEASIARIVERFSQVAERSKGRFELGFQTATANLYWISDSASRQRIFGMYLTGRFRVLLDYLKPGNEDVVTTIRALAKPAISIPNGEMSGGVFVDQNNVDAILSVIDAVVSALGQENF